MRAHTLLKSVRSFLATKLGREAEVCAADDEFSALSALSGSAPGKCRVVVFAGDLEPVDVDPEGLGCLFSVRVAVQVRRSLSLNNSEETEAELLTVEEGVRLWLLSMRFQRFPSVEQEATGEPPETPAPPHEELGTFRFRGSGGYTSPVADFMPEHPAREVRFSIMISLAGPAEVSPVSI